MTVCQEDWVLARVVWGTAAHFCEELWMSAGRSYIRSAPQRATNVEWLTRRWCDQQIADERSPLWAVAIGTDSTGAAGKIALAQGEQPGQKYHFALALFCPQISIQMLILSIIHNKLHNCVFASVVLMIVYDNANCYWSTICALLNLLLYFIVTTRRLKWLLYDPS